MTFLTPGLALLAAGIGVPVLILLHVLRLRRLPQRVPSTLLWRRSVQDLEANVPFQRLRFSWLLLLQLLALLAAAIAAGQPVVRLHQAPKSLAIVLDARARMRALVEMPTDDRDGPPPPTRFDLAKRDATTILDTVAADDTTVHLVAARARPALVASGSARSVRDAIDRLEVTDEPGDAAEAMALAAQVAPDGEIRWVGDPAGARSDNAGITLLSAQRGLEEPGTAEILVGAASSFSEPTETPLAVVVDGTVMAARVLRLPAADPERGAPGRATVLVRIPASPGALLEARLAVDDALPIDDSAWIRFAPATPIRVALLTADAAASPLPDLLALMESVQVTAQPCATDAAALGAFDLVVADGCIPPAAPGAAPTVPWLVFAWPEAPAPGGATAARPEDAKPETEDPAAPASILAASIAAAARSHPVLQGVPPFSVDILCPRAMAARIADRPAPAPPRLALLDDRGRALAWIDPRAPGIRFLFPLAATSWPADPSWVMLMQNAVLWLVGDDGEGLGTAIGTGRPARMLVERRDGSREWVAVPPFPRAGRLTVRASDGSEVEHRASLLDEGQSDLRIGRAPDDPRPREPAGSATTGRGASRGALVLWPFFAAAALALMLVEWLVYLAAMRRAG